jgi:IrrE N-terminal-like domain
MKSASNILGSELALKLLLEIWTPAVEAGRIQKEFDVRSLGETSAAAVRAGYEVSYVDLPTQVSGLAISIAGKPHIVINRAQSREDQQYTLPHELGHHILHLNPARDPDQSLLSTHKDAAEFEADMFAAAWVMFAARDQEREDVLRENPEVPAFMALLVLMTGGILLVALLGYLLKRLFPIRPFRALEAK